MTRSKKCQIKLKRAYEAPATHDGQRILVDRIWPRGVTKEELSLDGWAKQLAPSARLRKWFDHDPARWEGFKERYFRELDQNSELVNELKSKCGNGPVTLVFAAKDTRHNQAVALKQYLDNGK